MRVTTRHSPDFDICTDSIDPALSPYSERIPGYAGRIRDLYAVLGVPSALWTVLEAEVPLFFEPVKPVEYLLEIADVRVIAYIDELTWLVHLGDPRKAFAYSLTP